MIISSLYHVHVSLSLLVVRPTALCTVGTSHSKVVIERVHKVSSVTYWQFTECPAWGVHVSGAFHSVALLIFFGQSRAGINLRIPLLQVVSLRAPLHGTTAIVVREWLWVVWRVQPGECSVLGSFVTGL